MDANGAVRCGHCTYLPDFVWLGVSVRERRREGRRRLGRGLGLTTTTTTTTATTTRPTGGNNADPDNNDDDDYEDVVRWITYRLVDRKPATPAAATAAGSPSPTGPVTGTPIVTIRFSYSASVDSKPAATSSPYSPPSAAVSAVTAGTITKTATTGTRFHLRLDGGGNRAVAGGAGSEWLTYERNGLDWNLQDCSATLQQAVENCRLSVRSLHAHPSPPRLLRVMRLRREATAGGSVGGGGKKDRHGTGDSAMMVVDAPLRPSPVLPEELLTRTALAVGSDDDDYCDLVTHRPCSHLDGPPVRL